MLGEHSAKVSLAGKPPWTLDRLRGKKPRLRVGDRALFGENGKEGRARPRNPLLSSVGGSATLSPDLVPEGQDQIQQGAQEMAEDWPSSLPDGEGSARTSPASAGGPGTPLGPAGLRSLAPPLTSQSSSYLTLSVNFHNMASGVPQNSRQVGGAPGSKL